MPWENPTLNFPCTLEVIRETYWSAWLIQELENHVVISIDWKDVYLIKAMASKDGPLYTPITQDWKDISNSIKSIDTLKGQVSLEWGVVNYNDETWVLEKQGEYYVSYDQRDNSNPECKLYSCDNWILKQEWVMLYNCNAEIKPFTFNWEDISGEVSWINVSQQREDTVVYKWGEFLFNQITWELRSWSWYAMTYEPNNQNTRKFYQLYDVSWDTAKRAWYVLIRSIARNPESIFESATSITLNWASISERISEVRNQPYDGIEVKYKDIWLQVDKKAAAIKTYQGMPYGRNEEVTSAKALQQFYKLYNFDTETPLVCGYGIGIEKDEFIPITLNGKDVSREVSRIFESSPDRDSDEAMTIHGRVHVEIEGISFSLAPMTWEVVTLKWHPINLVEDGVNVYTLWEDGYYLEEEDNRFDITLNWKRVWWVLGLDYDRSSYKYDIHAIELDWHRISVDNETCELCSVTDTSWRQFVYCVYPHTVVYYFVNAGKLTFIQDKQKIEELEWLRKWNPETTTAKVNGNAMGLL